MAHHKSAQKALRQNRKQNLRNRNAKSTAWTMVKKVLSAVEAGDKERAATALRQAEGVLARTAQRGILPQQRVARKTSRLAKKVAALG